MSNWLDKEFIMAVKKQISRKEDFYGQKVRQQRKTLLYIVQIPTLTKDNTYFSVTLQRMNM